MITCALVFKNISCWQIPEVFFKVISCHPHKYNNPSVPIEMWAFRNLIPDSGAR